eukprot:m.23530 g.23530  ORF g.23530 m.23530 type:complete len:1326 (+) comp28494_c0_seq2:82-4059(+)
MALSKRSDEAKADRGVSEPLICLVKTKLQPNYSADGDQLWAQFLSLSCKDESILGTHKLAANGNLKALEEELDNNPEFVMNKDGDELLPLHWGAACGQMGSLDVLLRKCHYDRYTDRDLVNAMLWASRNGHLNIVALFLSSYGVDPRLRHECGDSAVHYASRFGRTDVVKYLLGKVKVPLDHPTFFGKYTPLHEAARHSRASVVKAILDLGADPDIGCQIRRTALMMSSERHDRSSRDCVRFLRHRRAEFLVADGDGRTVFDVATPANFLALLLHGAIPQSTESICQLESCIGLDLIERNRKILIADINSGSLRKCYDAVAMESAKEKFPKTESDQRALAHHLLLNMQEEKLKQDGVLVVWTAGVVHQMSKGFIHVAGGRCFNRAQDNIFLEYIRCMTERQRGGEDKLETILIHLTDDKRIVLAGSIGIPAAIKARGPEAVRHYHDALEGGFVRDRRVQVMLVGQFGAGKTSLKDSLLNAKFVEVKTSTVGLDRGEEFAIDRSRTSSSDWQRVEGREDQYDHTTQLAGKVFQAMFVNEGSDDEDEDRKSVFESGVYSSCEVNSQTPSICSKSSLSTLSSNDDCHGNDQQTSQKQGIELMPKPKPKPRPTTKLEQTLPPEIARKLEMYIRGLEQKKGKDHHITVSLGDFGGQKIFYSSHQLFLSSKAIYLLVYRLDQDQKEPAFESFRYGTAPEEVIESNQSTERRIEYLQFWGNSIRSLSKESAEDEDDMPFACPPVILVGTRTDQLPEEGRQEEVKRRMEDVYNGLSDEPSKHLTRFRFAVDNTRSGSESCDPEIRRLKQHIEEVARHLPHVGLRIPLTWLKFEEYVRQMVLSGRLYITLEEARKVAVDHCNVKPDGFLTMMALLHDQGIIVNFTEIESLLDLVILKPQWLADVVKQIITVPKPGENAGPMKKKWKYFQDGYLHESLLRHMLLKNEVCTAAFLKRHFATLVDILLRFDLICPCIDPEPGIVSPDMARRERKMTQPSDSASHSGRLYPEDDHYAITQKDGPQKRCYFVPAMMKPMPEYAAFYKRHSSDPEPLFYVFNFLPEGLFFRFVSKCCFRFPVGPNLHRYSCEFKFDDLELSVYVFLVGHAVKVAVKHRDNETPSAEACVSVKEFVDTVLRELACQPGFPRVKFRLCVQCEAKDGRPLQCTRHQKKNCRESKCAHHIDVGDPQDSRMVCHDCKGTMKRNANLNLWFGHGSKVDDLGSIKPVVDYSNDYSNVQLLNMNSAVLHAIAKRMDLNMKIAADWKALAGLLGFDLANVQTIGGSFLRDESPTMTVLTEWSTTGTATFGILLQHLKYLKRIDAYEAAIAAIAALNKSE